MKINQELHKEFERRKKRNPQYSLRSFARALGLDQSLLSKILSGKRAPSQETLRILERQVPSLGHHFNPMQEDVFSVMAEWQHFALLEFLKCEPNAKPARMARALGLTTQEARASLDRLKRLGLVGEGGDLLSPNNTWLNEQESSQARRCLQRELFAMALEAIDEVPFEERDHSSLTVACSEEDLPEVRTRIKRFRRGLDKILSQKSKPNNVYQLVIGFFPLTQERKMQ